MGSVQDTQFIYTPLSSLRDLYKHLAITYVTDIRVITSMLSDHKRSVTGGNTDSYTM